MRTKYCGVAAIVTLWVSISAGLITSELSLTGNRGLGHLVADPVTDLLYSGSLVVSSLFLAAFLSYVRRRYHSSSTFAFIYFIAVIGRFVTGVFPMDEPSVATLHTIGTFAVVASPPMVVLAFYLEQLPGPWRKVYGLLVATQITASVAGLMLALADRPILAQVVPVVSFQLWILVVTFKPYRGVEPLPGQVGSSGRAGLADGGARWQSGDLDDETGPLIEARGPRVRPSSLR